MAARLRTCREGPRCFQGHESARHGTFPCWSRVGLARSVELGISGPCRTSALLVSQARGQRLHRLRSRFAAATSEVLLEEARRAAVSIFIVAAALPWQPVRPPALRPERRDVPSRLPARRPLRREWPGAHSGEHEYRSRKFPHEAQWCALR